MTDVSGIALLSDLMRHASDQDPRPLFAPDRLRFVLQTLPDPEAAGRLRDAVAGIIGSDAFDLEPLFDEPAEVAEFFVLAPRGLDRTLSEDRLYDIADDLRRRLDLVSCEPDIGAPVFADPEETPVLTPEGAIVEATCWAKGEAPKDKLWALKATGVPHAWQLAPGQGRGIVIAQPDTGIADHAEFSDTVIDRSRTANILEGGTDPRDPLRPGMANPGHGTATGSVVASGPGGRIVGSAPRASLVPIRCIDDVRIFNGSSVARAIDHATRTGADIISMSLGGIFSMSMRAAVRAAVAHDIIVVAAAGNCVGVVVWPAFLDACIAVGGTREDDGAWQGSSSGDAVDFAAPAEFVWRADRRKPTDPDDVVTGGQGTSFATALTAGIAALWLERHGRSAVRQEARRRGTVVQELFRAAVRQTARRPPGFPAGLGAGIIDAGALLSLALRDIRLIRPEVAGGTLLPGDGLSEALEQLLGSGRPDPGFDWAAHGAELSALLLADARAGRGRAESGPEARAFRRPSRALVAAASRAADPRLAQIVLRGPMAAPALVLPDERDAAARLGPLVSGLGAATRPDLAPESAGRISPEDGAGLLDAAGRERLLGRLRRRGTEAALPAVVEDIELLDDTLARLHREGTSATLDMPALIMAEALVSLTERPAIPVAWSTEASPRVQTIDPNHPELGRFAGSVALLQSRLQTARLESVGRIDSGWQHVGTGFVVGPDLVLTNRHVLESCADPVPRRHAPAGWILRPHVTVNFSPGGDEAAHRFAVTDVVLAGDAPILGRPIDFDNLDLALLRVEASNAAGTALPGPVDVVPAGADWRQGLATLYLVGFPAPPGYLPQDEEGRIRRDVVDRLVQLFGIGFHRKFFSPGSVMGAGHKWVFDHDATTLGGNSGSLVGRLVNDCAAVGLHFAGDWLRANHAHDLAAVRAGHAALDARL